MAVTVRSIVGALALFDKLDACNRTRAGSQPSFER